MKRIAIPVIDGKLSEYFSRCNYYKIVEIRNTQVIGNRIKAHEEMEIALMPLWISEQGITDVVSSKIDGRIMDLFAQYKINLYVGIKCESPDEIIQNYLKGKLISDELVIAEINKNKYERK